MTKAEHAALAAAAGVPAHQLCWYCLVPDSTVEAAGMWHCPNPRCTGPSGGQARHIRECTVCRTQETEHGTDVLWTCIVFDENHAEISEASR